MIFLLDVLLKCGDLEDKRILSPMLTLQIGSVETFCTFTAIAKQLSILTTIFNQFIRMVKKQGTTNPQSVDVPYEIWTSIASYLSWVEVQSLFSLNRFFLNQYLRTKYGTVHIGEMLNPQAFLSLKRLKWVDLGTLKWLPD